MNGCRIHSASCDGLDVRPIRRYLRHGEDAACVGCRRALDKLGMAYELVERRVATVPVARDRRRFVPTWLRNLTARDNTGEVVAA